MLATFLLPFATGIPLPDLEGTLNIWLGAIALAAVPLAPPARAWAAMLVMAAMVLACLPQAGAGLAAYSQEAAENGRRMVQILQDVAERRPDAASPPRRLMLVGAPTPFTGMLLLPGFEFGVHILAQFEARGILGPGVAVDYCPRGCDGFDAEAAAIAAAFPAPGALLQRGEAWILRIGPDPG
jgi:hypothetical protein